MKPRNRYRIFGRDRLDRAKRIPLGVGIDGTKGPRQLIEQAARDISRGLRDTDVHGTPSNVPGPGHAPANSPGAEVPPEGINADK